MRTLSIILFFINAISCSDGTTGIKGQSFIHNKTVQTLHDSIKEKLINGDIILRRGDGPLSFHLSRTTGEKYTHCGVIFKNNDKLGVIHTLGSEASSKEIDGVQTTSLDNFVALAADSVLYICRPIFKPNIGKEIFKQAKYYLNKKVPFDHRFTLLTKDKFYCSELLYYIFKDVNNGENIFTIKKQKKAYILMFSTFYNSTNFKTIFEF